MVYASRLGSHVATVALKYAVQWFRTARILRREDPDVVFVMTPPVFAAMPAFWYGWRRRKPVVLDAHTCAFVLPRWSSLQWLQRVLCRRAATTLVTNQHIGGLVQAADGDATLVPDVPVIFPAGGRFARETTLTVVVVCSFDVDEPLSAMVDAAKSLQDVQFFVTGDPSSLPDSTKASLPRNMTLTGFLNTADYGTMISNADAVMDLTTHDHTMLRGAYEAIYQGVPVIVSDWPLLRQAFPFGALHVDNTPDAIARAVRKLQHNLVLYRTDAERLRRVKLQRWQTIRAVILTKLGAASNVDRIDS